MADPVASASLSPAPARPPRRALWADGALGALVVAFAFLAASFAARNSDLWMHLAAGRLLATGGYSFGVDPFTYTAQGVYWANHAWLFDLILYGAYQSLGGEGLVVLKAAGVALLALVMLRTARSSPGPFWVAAACVLLAVLAASPRLLLQPACLSLLLLAGCQCLLLARGRALYAVPALIALWVNLDGWFLLGPLVVVLFWLGHRLTPNSPRLPLWLLPASLAACLLSPHHISALTLPPELSPAVWDSSLHDDPRLAGFFTSPWRLGPLGKSGGYSLAAWGYLVLLAAGAASFVVNRRAAASWRGVVWLAFAGLSAWQARLVPFFAVVAGPITALNFRECITSSALDRFGRVAVGVVAVALSVVAWPGWLQGFYVRDRAIAWKVEPDPSLERAAQAIANLRQRGELPADARLFTSHPDVTHYLAWFAPGERGFIDSRLQLFTGVASDYVQLSRSLGLVPGDALAWEEVIRQHQVTHAVVYDPTPVRLTLGLHKLARPAEPWTLLRVDGYGVLVAYRGTGPLDAERAAFGPPREGELPAAPAAGPDRLPQPARWWDLAARRSKGREWEGDAASVYLRLFEVSRETVPSPGGSADRSPALPLLAVRGGRCAVAANPESDEAWLTLARSYLVLGRGTWESTGELNPRGFLRHAQTAACLYNAALLNPDALAAHESLALLHSERHHLDLALGRLRVQLRLTRRNGPLPGEPVEAFGERVNRLTTAIERTEEVIQDAENLFLIRTHRMAGEPLGRARVARDLGLAGKAIDVLVKSHPDLYGPEGLRLLLDLLLSTGQADAAGALLERDELVRNPEALGFYELPGTMREGRRWSYLLPAYDWFTFAQAAAVGRYDRAIAALDRVRQRVRDEARAVAPRVAGSYSLQLAMEVWLAAPPAIVLSRLHFSRERERVGELVFRLRMVDVQEGDFRTLAGLLRLEQGSPAAAADEFARALDLYARAKDVQPSPGGQPLASRYLDAIRRQAR